MPVRSTLRLVAGELAEALLPQRCLVCGRFGSPLHDRCVDRLPAAAAPRCEVCWSPGASPRCEQCALSPPAFTGLRTPFRFTGPARRALLEAKFRSVTGLLEPLAAAAAVVVPAAWRVEAVVPVPLHAGRERRRGYKQARIAARVVADRLGVRLESSALRRARATPPQVGLSAAERAVNLRGAFEAPGPSPARLLLVDDVTTTGATFHEAAAELRSAGADAVYALALARED